MDENTDVPRMVRQGMVGSVMGLAESLSVKSLVLVDNRPPKAAPDER